MEASWGGGGGMDAPSAHVRCLISSRDAQCCMFSVFLQCFGFSHNKDSHTYHVPRRCHHLHRCTYGEAALELLKVDHVFALHRVLGILKGKIGN